MILSQPDVKFTCHVARADRRHFLNEEDVKVLLSRLPAELYHRLKVVHFNDRSRGGQILGYTTTHGRREITICAQPPRFSLGNAMSIHSISGFDFRCGGKIAVAFTCHPPLPPL